MVVLLLQIFTQKTYMRLNATNKNNKKKIIKKQIKTFKLNCKAIIFFLNINKNFKHYILNYNPHNSLHDV